MTNGPRTPDLYTYSDPSLSLWQAAVAEVHRRRDSIQNRMDSVTSGRGAAPKRLLAQDDLMSPVHILGAPLREGKNIPSEIASPVAEATQPLTLAASAEPAAAVPIDCAKVAAQFLWAEITGNFVYFVVDELRTLLYFPYSFFTTAPPFITNFTCWSVVTS